MRMSHRLATGLLAGVLALSLSAAALAQRGRGRGQAGPVPAVLLAKLNLNDEQKTKVKAAEDALKAEQAKIRDLSTPQEKRQATRKAMTDYRASLQTALNEDQQKQLQLLVEEARQYQGMGPLGNQLAGLTPTLSDEQKTKIKEIAAKYQPELQKLREEQRTATDKAAVRQKMMDTNKKVREEVVAILTDDQKKSLRANAPGRRNQK